MDDVKYGVALTVLNGLVGLRFAALRRAMGNATYPPPSHNEAQIEQLRYQFQESCDLRDNLHSVGVEGWQAVIEQYGPMVRQGAAAHATASQGSAA